MNDTQIKRWRLILGEVSEEEFEQQEQGDLLSEGEKKMDSALGAIYDNSLQSGGADNGKSKTKIGGLKKSAPALAKWLGDIRECFDSETVTIVQKDAMQLKGLKELLYEPEILENVEPDIYLVSTLLTLKEEVPEGAKEQVRKLIKKFVDDLQESLSEKIEPHVRGLLNKRLSSPIPRYDSINWSRTIRQNLKNFNPESGKIYPEKIHFFAHKRKTANWEVFIDIDQSASMAESMVYAAVMGSIFASLRSIKTKVVAFDTSVVDLSEECGDDPVDMLYGMQLGGGTDINRSVTYLREYISEPERSIFILISDLYEGGNRRQLVSQMQEMKESGVQVICLLSISNEGTPWYDELIAKEFRNIDIPCFACSPEKLPEIIKDVLSGKA